MLDKLAMLPAKTIAGILSLSFKNLPVNSAAMWFEIEKLPPLPAKINLLFF